METVFFKNVAMYLRKSRAEEGEKTDEVLARHKAQLTRYAHDHGVNVTGIYEEVVSGDSLFSRPEMLELLGRIENGEYTGVLCVDIDRLGRGNMKEQGLILETFKDSGTAIITPEKIYDLNDEFDETQSEFKTFMARQELKIIKKRLKCGLLLTLQKGGYVSNIPFGYKRAYKDKIPTLAPEPQEEKLVKLIFSMYTQGHGCQEICGVLNAMGAKPRRGYEFTRSSVRKILTNPVYTGKVIWGRQRHIRPKSIGERNRTVSNPEDQWIVVKGLHPAIISGEIFREAGVMLSQKRHPPCREREQISNPFAGILFCAKCGRAMTKRTIGNKKIPYILCPTRGCMKASRFDYVENAVISVLAKIFENAGAIELIPENPQMQIPYKTVEENLKTQLSRIQNQKNNLCNLLEQGLYSPEIFKKRDRLLSERADAIACEIKKIYIKGSRNEEHITGAAQYSNNLLEKYKSGTPAEKNILLKSLIKRAFYYKDKSGGPREFVVDIELNGSVFRYKN